MPGGTGTTHRLKMHGGALDTGGQAKFVIQNGEVEVNGEVCTMRGKKMRDGDYAEYNGGRYTVKVEE
ncbi:RNA-binding S4 domain-containing protein [Hominenteromicrobium sp.]|uniref:RNA-binding S4 domain-containing protein n=1 Tax=Hominenteromicrobium sp. TaxID=3073581 RepID=UPI003A901DA9